MVTVELLSGTGDPGFADSLTEWSSSLVRRTELVEGKTDLTGVQESVVEGVEEDA